MFEVLAGINAIVGLLEKSGIARPLVWKRKKVPLTATLGTATVYEPNSVTVACVDSAALTAAISKGRPIGDLIRPGLDIAYVCPTTLVVALTNTSGGPDAQVVHVTECIVQVSHYTAPSPALSRKSAVLLPDVMAGGRGSEGQFQVTFKSREKATIRIFRHAHASNPTTNVRMQMNPGEYSEIQLLLLPILPGRYRIQVHSEVTAGRTTKTISADHIAHILWTDSTTWPEQVVVSREAFDGSIEFSDIEHYRRVISEKGGTIKRGYPPTLPEGRRPEVSGDLATEAFR